MKQAIYRNYVRLVLLGISLYLLVSMLFVYWVDPYWIYHDEPPWLEKWGGHNRVFDRKMRFVKSLQVIVRQPKTVILGSSRVYRGIPITHKDYIDTYNMGISGLRIREVYAYLQYLTYWTDVSEVILGLDYFMFDHSQQMESGFDPMLADHKYLFKALPASLITSMAIEDALIALKGKRPGDGFWNYLGFKKTNPRGAEDVTRVLNGFYTKPQEISNSEYRVFSDIIKLANDHDLKLKLFISPLNSRMINRMREQGGYFAFREWVDKVENMVAHAQGEIGFLDFSENNPFFQDDTIFGSSKYWIDTSHYSPVVGLWILQQLGPLLE